MRDNEVSIPITVNIIVDGEYCGDCLFFNYEDVECRAFGVRGSEGIITQYPRLEFHKNRTSWFRCKKCVEYTERHLVSIPAFKPFELTVEGDV